jgi:hypothetical protein
MKNKNDKRRLAILNETIRQLSKTDLKPAVGGVVGFTTEPPEECYSCSNNRNGNCGNSSI